MGRNRSISCPKCSKKMRSDKAKLHLQKCGESSYPTKDCPICLKTMIKWNMPRHMKQHENRILVNLKEDQATYERLAETGKMVEEHVSKEDINPKSLRKEYIEALDVHHSEAQDEKPISLNPWQEKLLGLMEPSDRKILWIRGRKGNEGKSWFQNYLQVHYGKRRVFRSTLVKNTESLLHTLSKRNLSFLDVFIFNIPRSFDTQYVPYGFLEDIKDGKAISTKYNSRELKFVTPNIVIVFSNDTPYAENLSFDRWKMYDISRDRLHFANFSKGKKKDEPYLYDDETD